MPQPLDEWQELLLVDLVEASRKLPEHEQTDFVVIEPPGTSGTCLLRHAGLEPGYATHPLHLVMLESWGHPVHERRRRGSGRSFSSRTESRTTRTSSGAVYAAPSRAGGTRSADRIRARCPPRTRTSSLGAWRSWTGLHFADRDNVMAAVTGYFQKNFDRPCPDSVAVWQRAIPHLVTASYMLEILDTDEFVDGSFGAWVKRAVTEWREGPGRGP